MDFRLNEAQQAISALARKIFDDRLTPARLKAAEATPEGFDRGLWKDLAEAGLLAAGLPESAGGSGHGILELCALLVEAGAAVAPVPLWSALILGALPIAQFGSPEQKARLLPGFGRGEHLLSGAIAEPGSDDPRELRTSARPAGSAWTLSGTKHLVPIAQSSSRILVPAHSAEGGVGLFLLDPRAQGVKLERQITTTGEIDFKIVLENARVEAVDVLVDPRGSRQVDAAAALDWIVERATVGLCAQELGVAERALRITAEYTISREQFERPIATFQAVAQRAADAYIDVEAIRLATWRAAWLLDRNEPARKAVAQAKYWAAEAGHRVVYASQHLHGGIGFDLEYPLHRYYRWSKQLELTLGGASVQLARLGSSLIG